jgi:arylsulfatase A-like enzyme
VRALALAALACLSACQPFRAEIARARVPRVVLVSIDTLHVQWTSAYNPDVGTTPFLARVASEGVRFERAYTEVPITLPSHASILTGVSPQTLGVFGNGDVVPESAVTLAEIFSEAGYRTAAFISLGVLQPAFRLDQGFQTFHDPFETDSSRWYRTADEVIGPVSEWIHSHRDDPFFLWVHLSDPHEPYLPVGAPPDTEIWLDEELLARVNLISMERHDLALRLPPGRHRLRFVSLRPPKDDDRPETAIELQLLSQEALLPYASDELPTAIERLPLRPSYEIPLHNRKSEAVEVALSFSGMLERPAPSDVLENYKAEVAYVDEHLQKLDALLAELGPREDTLLVIVSDHGEGLFSHDLLGHATFVFEDQLRVAWIMRGAGLPEGRVVTSQPALLIDVAPTVLELVGLKARGMEGQSRLSCWERDQCPETPPWWSFGLDHETRRLTGMSGYRWPYKWMWRRSFPRSGFDLESDPWERVDLLEDPGPHNPEPLKEMAESFRKVRRDLANALRRSQGMGLTKERERLLRSLGYLKGK